MADETDYLTATQVAAALGVTSRTVRRWADAGLIPHFVTPGGRYRFPAEAVEQIAEPA